MTNSPHPGQEPEPQTSNHAHAEQDEEVTFLPPPHQRPPWRKIGWGILALLLLSMGGGLGYGWYFVQRRLSPLVENNLEQALNRPVELGDVEAFTIGSLRFDESVIPATETDRDRATIETVRVRFNPLALLFQRRLEINATLVNPEIYVEQDAQGEWIATRIQPTEKEGFLTTVIETVGFKDADVLLVGSTATGELKEPVPVFVDQAKVTLRDDNQLIQFALDATLEDSGSFELTGEYASPSGELKLAFSGGDLDVAPLGRLVRIPVNLESGEVGGNLEVLISPEEPLQLTGVATLDNVAASLPQLPVPIRNTNGQIRFNDTEVSLERVTTRFGQIPVVAEGTVDTEGSANVVVETAAVDFQTVLQTFNVEQELPVPVTGEAKAAFQIAGTLSQPQVEAVVFTTQPTQIDQFNFSQITAEAVYEDSVLALTDFQADLATGGQLLGEGLVQVQENGQVSLNLRAQNLSGTAIAQLYELNLPVPVGEINAQARIVTTLQQPAENLRIASANATANVAGGLVNLTDLQLLDNRWQATVATSGLNLEQLQQIPPQLQQGSLSGTFQLTGGLETFALNTLDVTGTARLNLPEGLIAVRQIQVNNGNWQATLATTGLEVAGLAQVPPRFQDATVAGSFQVAGNLDNLQAVSGSGNLNVDIAGGDLILTELQLADQLWQANLLARGLNLNRLAPQLPTQIESPLSGRFQLSGNLAEGANLASIQGTGTAQVDIDGGTVRATSIRLQGGNFQVALQANQVPLSEVAPQLPPRFQSPFTGSFDIAGSLEQLSPETIRVTGQGQLGVGERTVALSELRVAQGRFQVDVVADNVPLQSLAPQLPQRLAGDITGTFNLAGALANPRQTLEATGQGRLAVDGGVVTLNELQVAQGRFQADVVANEFPIRTLAPQLPPSFAGEATGTFDLAGNLDNLQDSLQVAGQGQLAVEGGVVTLNQLQVAQGRFQAEVVADEFPIRTLAPQLPPSFAGEATGTFDVAGNLANPRQSLQLTGQGQLAIAEGTVTLNRLQIAQGRFQGDIVAEGVSLQALAPQLPPRFTGEATGTFDLAGNLANPRQSLQLTGQGQLVVPEGVITAQSVQISGGQFEAILDTEGFPLAAVSEQLQGEAIGQIAIAGSLDNLTPTAITARGDVLLTEGIGVVDRPLTTRFRLADERLEILEASAQGLDVRGTVDVNLAERGLAIVENLNIDVDAENLNLAQLPITLPPRLSDLNLAGTADFDGIIRGTPTAPNVQGDIALRNFGIGIAGLNFDPVLTGTVQATPGQGARVNLTGVNDRIQLALGPNNRPQSFLISLDEAFIQGERQGDLLLVDARSFPIDLAEPFVSLPPLIAGRDLGGQLSGELAVNLETLAISGEITITNPVLGNFQGDLLTAALTYRNGMLAVERGQLVDEESRYGIEGRFERTPAGPQYNFEVAVAQGRIQTLISALQISTFNDLLDLRRGFGEPTGSATDLAIVGVGLPEEPLITQLRRLAEVETLLEQQQQQQEDSPLPDLDQLQGTFSGTVAVASTPQTGLEAQFDLQGQEWNWGRLQAQQIVAEGVYADGVVTFVPLQIQKEDALIAFSGSLGGEEQAGQLRFVDFPVSELQALVNLPPAFRVTGDLNAVATIAGSIDNPIARGEIALTDGSIGQTPIQATQASFSYGNARLNFSGVGTLSEDADPLTATGSIPFTLPFAAVEPESNELNVSIEAQDDALALLNAVSRQQVAWLGGQGALDLDISGTYDPETNRPSVLVAEGIATFQDATIEAQALPDAPLTNVNGRILFNFDEIEVERFRGDFSGGELAAEGILPISRDIPQDNPLSVRLRQLALNLKGLYEGGVAGQLEITGNLLEPNIGGALDVYDGQVLLAANGGGGGGGTGSPRGAATAGSFRSQVGLNDLLLSLGDDVQITRPPLLNFVAQGDLLLSGTLADIRPDGVIELTRGQVNLFTTRFRLVGGVEHTARFMPEEGLDPILDIQLATTVTETTRQPIATSERSAEIADIPATGFGALETVRVTASVEGPASELTENLVLSSDPPRSETELVALIGGGFVNNLGQGDPTLGLASLAGSTLLGGVQNALGNALGASEFRLYPTPIIDEDADADAGIGLGAEAAFQVTDQVYASVQKVVTTDEPFRFGLIYRLNEQFLIRSFGNLEGDGAAAVEYDVRF